MASPSQDSAVLVPASSQDSELIDSEPEVESEVTDQAQSPDSPWPFLDNFVSFKRKVGDNYVFQCLTCLPKIVEVRVHKGTKANLKSHFNRIHPDKIKLVEDAIKVGGRRSRLSSHSSDGGAATATTSSSSKKRRQMSIAETFGIMSQGSHVLQSSVDRAIVHFVVDNMLALQIVDSPTFRDLVGTLNPSKEVPSRRTLGRRLIDIYEEMKETLIR